jgi:hypothetical protein
LAQQLVEARLIASTYFDFLTRSGGPITTKGRSRRAVDGYFRAADRVAKYAALVGLDRRPRELAPTSAREWLEAVTQTPEDAAAEKEE